MQSRTEHLKCKVPLPPNLSKENVGIWLGWTCKNDREVVREAATKGVDMNLVNLFLSQRQNSTPEKAEEYFKNEVKLWVNELLNRKQIFRALHVLKNTTKDPDEELSRVLFITTNSALRDYIGEYLKKENKIEEKTLHLAHFLDLILRNTLLTSRFKLPEESIGCLDKQSAQWKAEVAAKLFLRTYDAILMPFITGESLWNQLLIYNDSKLLTSWVNLHYGQSLSNNINENLQKLFKTHPITDEMIQELYRSDASPQTREKILNEFCQYGIFCKEDRYNLSNLLKRFVKSKNISDIHEILGQNTSNVTTEDFLNLLVPFCVEHKLLTVLNATLEHFKIPESLRNKYVDVDLISDCRELEKCCNKQSLQRNIYKISRYLARGDLEAYFSENPLIFLALILLQEDVDFVEVIENKKVSLFGQTFSKSVSQLFKNYRVIELIHKREEIVQNCDLTYYDMLDKHLDLDVRRCFGYHFENKPYPHFGDENLIKKYGYTKEINHIFYVREQRPSIASKFFLVEQYKEFGCVPEESVRIVKKKIFKLAMKNFSSSATGASCVAFLEMIGLSSEFVRVCLLGAKILLDSGQHFDDVVDLFMNVENDPYTVLKSLEDQVIESIDFSSFDKGEKFVEAIKSYDVVVRFSLEYNNQKLPEMFLRMCAHNNLWLPFLIYAQIKNYPPEQIKVVVQSFKNPTLLEHILHSVMHDFQVDEQNIMRERDSRKAFLSRVGVRASLENINMTDSMTSSIYSRSSFGSAASSAGSEFLEIDISNTKTTLLQVLIKSHNSRDPPRALLQACQLYRCPLLAILATSYEPDSYITNWLTWLGVSCRQYELFTNFEAMASNSCQVSSLLNDCMKNRFPKTLQQSFEIFLPDNPLTPFLEFLNLCIQQKFEITTLTSKLASFKSQLEKCRRYSVIAEVDNEMTYLVNKGWIERNALLLLSSAINWNMNSTYEQILFVKVLTVLEIWNYFKCPALNRLLEILQTICELEPRLRFDIETYFDSKNGRQPVIELINTFLEKKLFDGALRIAQIEGLPADLILVKQWQDKFQNGYENDNDISFWKESSDAFTKHNVTADCVVEFYLENLERVESNWEKYNLLKLAYDWAKKFELSNQFELEKRKWYRFILIEDKWSDLKTEEILECLPLSVSYKEMLDMLDKYTPYEKEVSQDFLKSVQGLINDVLDKDNIWLALKLEKIFNCKTVDLDRLKVGFGLGEGLVMPYQLDIEQRLLFTDVGQYKRLEHRRMYTSTRLSTASSASFSFFGASRMPLVDNVDIPTDETLALLITLTEKITHGSGLAYTILRSYRISINVEIPYHVVISTPDSTKFLRDVLEDDCMNKLDVVHDFCYVYKWSKDQIADFICEEIINASSKYIKSKTDQFLLWDLKMDQDFYLVLQILQENCSLLGHKLYIYANTVHKSQVLTDMECKISELALVVELLIKAHDCFTADCNVEGISTILKKCKTLTNHLVTLRSWKLIVRLLTGVGRYTEMKYVFHVLKENDQFEYLLSKGSKKDNNLKNALLTYLRKCCPDDRELYKLVALHFALFSEVALLWEREAQSVIKNLIEISKLEMENNKLDPKSEPFVLLSNSDGTKICLNRAKEDYTHATEFHLKGEKFGKALHSARQAELIALQISLLKGLPPNGTATCILNLTSAQIQNLVCNQLCFYQTSILVESYQFPLDWSLVLYEKCIIKHDLEYLHVFLKHHLLEESLVHDISRRFIAANINTTPEINCMKNVLDHLMSVHAKYRIASELGFTDIVEDLLKSGQLAFLKDTVWKKGYKSED